MEIHILTAATAMRKASIRLSQTKLTFLLARLPIKVAGIVAMRIGTVNHHSICPLMAFPRKPADVDRVTIARLLPIAILVGICT
jgi:hypothetical protein